jgi:uncharacterized protein
MSITGWTRTESPFHTGELAIHDRLGTRDQMDQQGRRIIREFLTEQHRRFFAQLPYAIVGTVDTSGNPWASVLVGNPGFLSSPSDRTLQVAATPLVGDPLASTLTVGCDIGLLGIELSTRRRNRLNGVLTGMQEGSFTIQVQQSFGNCPQYIQARTLQREPVQSLTDQPTIVPVDQFLTAEHHIIERSDTFFIATAYQADSAGFASGVDVAHRGGKPGFVRINGDRTLTIPDFSGNNHFNTFGNLALNPRAGLLLIDFDQGDLLYLTGTAQVIWEGEEIVAYAGAERLLRFHLDRGYRVQNSLPLRWSAPEFSPFLDRTGSWSIHPSL